MKKILSIFLFSSCFTTIWAQNSQQNPPVKQPDFLQLKESSYNFGKIPQGRPVTHVFEVINNGNEPLALENVQASCGCTTPEWSNDPIAPGGSKKITVGYNSASEGAFEKNITITYNKGQTKIIIIKGTVWKTPDQSAPKNNSLAILKNIN